MNPIVRFAYAAAGSLAEAAAAVAPPGGGKVRRSFSARRDVRERFIAWGRQRRDASRPLLWFHAPSVGEGLQARPVLEALRAAHPEIQLAYTWFSPSAESFAKALDVDVRDVLPFDTRSAARAALDALRPSALVFSKLDVWPTLVEEAKRRDIPLALLSATLAPGSSRTHPVAKLLLRDAYAALDVVGAISRDDATRLVALGCRPEAVRVTGDTRFDQVIARAARVDRASGLLQPLRSDRPTLVVGSSWPADERALLPAIAELHRSAPRFRTIIAPHEPTPAHLAPIREWAASAQLRSATLGGTGATAADVVVVDRVGVLGDLYALADIAFVGGGFHAAGLHSVLEPAAFQVPVIFGPRHHGSRDAGLLLAAGAARSVDDQRTIVDVVRHWIEDPGARRAAGAAARRLVEENAGATARSVTLIEGLLEQTPATR
ncbi:MAG TPA: glycosyltransferase N-terminal domain-containing protein [Gemmatimonadaceae bacterium]|nr:glycosyltransferase N-terminal domain-containing protein [Gemmatimonadaceae bacterium]